MSQRLQDTSIKGIVFDMDGVLVDTSPSHAAAYEKLWQSLSIDGPEYPVIAGRGTKEVVAEYAGHLSQEQLDNAVSLKQEAALGILETADISYNDTREALSRLQSIGMPMLVATSASKASAELALKNANIKHFFSAVITAADVERAKPAPDLFVKGIEAHDLLPKQVLILEDSYSGVLAALASGAFVVAVRDSAELDNTITKQTNFLGYFDDVADVVTALVHNAGDEVRL